MNIFKATYIQFYKASNFARNNIPGSLFDDPPIHGVIGLTSIQIINIVSVWLYFDLDSVTHNKNFDLLLFSILLLTNNLLFYVRGKNYQRSIEEFMQLKEIVRILYYLISLLYIFASIRYFYLIHSGQLHYNPLGMFAVGENFNSG